MKKKESSFRGNVPWSVKLQPMVLHIVPEALPKKKKKKKNPREREKEEISSQGNGL